MKTKTIEGIEVFWCDSYKAWITETGCRANLKTVAEGMENLNKDLIYNIDDIQIDRILGCSSCARYKGTPRKEILRLIESELYNLCEEFNQAYEELERQNEDCGESQRRAWRNWYYRQKEKE